MINLLHFIKKTLILFLLLLSVSISTHAKVLFSDSKLGKVVLHEGEENKPLLMLNEKTILTGNDMFYRFYLEKVFDLSDSKILIIGAHGDAQVCPTTFYIIEISSYSKYKLTDNFGSCASARKIWKRGETIFLEIPEYIQWPSALTSLQIRKLKRIVYFYSYKNSTLKVTKSNK